MDDSQEKVLPAITSYGLEDEMPISQDFYRKLAPFAKKINVFLGVVVLCLGILILSGVVFIGLFINLSESYVTDGHVSCQIKKVDASKLTK